MREASIPEPIGVYLHLPFCEERCTYCDFLTFPHAEAFHAPYLEALVQDLRRDARRRGLLQRACDSIFFGGGTPSLFSPATLGRLMETLRSVLVCTPDCEVTLEANPATLSLERLRGYRAIGINRLSLGVQTFDDALLQSCRRTHRGNEVKADIEAIREAGFTNLSFDLISGLPGQGEEQIRADLEAIARWQPEHVSWYSLIVEPRTLLYTQLQTGEQHLPEEEVSLRMEDLLCSGLQALGYERYEISNYARASYASRHNLKYWTGKPYWGVGLGADSYLDGQRSQVVRTFQAYFRALEEDEPPWQEETRTPQDDLFEFLMMGFRLIRGIDRRQFEARYHRDLLDVAPELFDDYRRRGWLIWDDTHCRLQATGLALQNVFLSDLWAAIETP